MTVTSDKILDFGLTAYADANLIHACTAEPANFAGVAAVSLGSTTVAVGAIVDMAVGTPSGSASAGRGRVITPAGGATYGAGGTITHYAVVDTATSTLLVANTVATSKTVNIGDAIDLDPMTFKHDDPVSV